MDATLLAIATTNDQSGLRCLAEAGISDHNAQFEPHSSITIVLDAYLRLDPQLGQRAKRLQDPPWYSWVAI